MLARIVYPVLVLAPGRLARDSPPRAGGVGVAARSRPRQMAVQQPYPGASR